MNDQHPPTEQQDISDELATAPTLGSVGGVVVEVVDEPFTLSRAVAEVVVRSSESGDERHDYFELSIGRCAIRVWPENQYLETCFEDGTKVPAAPQDNDYYRGIAERNGYGTDTWRQCFEHEVLHTWLRVQCGDPFSLTLWGAAHGVVQRRGLKHDEEQVVFAFQQLLNGAEVAEPDWLADMHWGGHDMVALKEQALALLRPQADEREQAA